MVLGCFSFLFFQCLEQFKCYRQFSGAFWSEEGLFRFLVGRSSSSEYIGLCKFVMEIVPDC